MRWSACRPSPVARCAGAFIDRATERGRRVGVDAAEDLCLWADPMRLRQAFGNLVDNALRHGDGDVTLPPPAERRSKSKWPTRVRFADDIAERAFERLHSRRRGAQPGWHGLGLRSCGRSRGARRHGGDRPRPGARVRVWIPAPAGWHSCGARCRAISGWPKQRSLRRRPDGAQTARTADPGSSSWCSSACGPAASHGCGIDRGLWREWTQPNPRRRSRLPCLRAARRSSSIPPTFTTESTILTGRCARAHAGPTGEQSDSGGTGAVRSPSTDKTKKVAGVQARVFTTWRRRRGRGDDRTTGIAQDKAGNLW
jgi:hypothetical protein